MSSSVVVELAPTVLILDPSGACAVERVEVGPINPDALAVKATFEALDTNDSEQKPEEADEKRHIDKQWGGFFQTPQDDLITLASRSRDRFEYIQQCHSSVLAGAKFASSSTSEIGRDDSHTLFQ